MPETPPSPPAAAVEPGEAPRSIESLVESYSNRLTEDETLRGNLADDEFEPLLSWAFDQLQHLATRCVALPDAEAAHRFERGALQIVDLLRLIDVALEDRSLSPPVVVASRLEMLDTCLAPPLLDEELAARARSRLSNLLTSPPEELQRLDRAALIDQVLAVLR